MSSPIRREGSDQRQWFVPQGTGMGRGEVQFHLWLFLGEVNPFHQEPMDKVEMGKRRKDGAGLARGLCEQSP